MKSKSYKMANHTILRFLLGWLVRRLYRIKISGKEVLKLKPPYIVMPNHMGLWDPVIVSVCMPHTVHYITSDQNFRFKLLSKLFHALGCIPKKKSMADMRAIKNMMYVKKNGGVIGLFPEGKRNWDGCTDDVLYPTAKLIKSLNIPVLAAIMRGGYLSRPRWSLNSRIGHLYVDFSLAMSTKDIASMTTDDIYTRMTQALAYDEYAWQDKAQIRFKGRRLAEKLELALFMCPECHAVSSMRSSGAAFFCSACGYRVKYTEYGYFEQASAHTLHHANPRDWFKWQQGAFKDYLSANTASDNAVLSDDCMTLLRAENGMAAMQTIGIGRAELFKDRITWTLEDVGQCFDLKKIRGMNIQANYKIDYYYEDMVWQLRQDQRNVSGLKWSMAVEYFTERLGNTKDEGL